MFDQLSWRLTTIMFVAWFIIAGTATIVGELLR